MNRFRSLLLLLFIGFSHCCNAQHRTAADFGYRHLRFGFEGDSVDILIRSAPGAERTQKPLFFFCQGSLPQPLIKTSGRGAYGVFSFQPDSLAADYHLAIAGKPGVPLIVDESALGPNFMYTDSNGRVTRAYSDRNLPDYYVRRNLAIIAYLQRQAWISNKELVVAGHSEGAAIAARMAPALPRGARLIFSGGNPMGRMLSILGERRAHETDSNRAGEEALAFWQEAIDHAQGMDFSRGDTYRADVDFSVPPLQWLLQLDIPVLVSYGTRDWSAPFNDYLRVETIRRKANNFTYLAYVGTEHNYFPLLPDGRVNYEVFNWDRVAGDWLRWLRARR